MKTIILTGMPGSGKTSVGKLLAQVLNMEFIDSDFEIEKSENLTISQIFELKGEKYFRNIEHEIIKQIFKSQNQILSIGGGAFENPQTQEFLLNNANVIYLQASPEIIYQRTRSDNTRPLLKDNNSDKIKKLLQNREKNYKLARFTVLTDNKDVETIVREICKCVN